ncbi:MAG: sialidase family protein [Myxococcaceae bacterium]
MLCALTLAALAVAGATDVAPVAGGNALTLPVQRHILRMTPSDSGPVWLFAVQQQGTGGHALGLYRSSDEGASWQYAGAIQDDASHTDRAELLASGNDLLVLYSIETPAGIDIGGSTRHDVVLQRWKYGGHGTWTKSSTSTVFDSTSNSTAYYRATMTRDSQGRLWVAAFKLETNDTSSVVVASSTDGGASFTRQTLGGSMTARAGGRIDAVAGKVIVLFDEHDAGSASRYFLRSDDSPVGTWSGLRTAWSEGIYHGAAYSSVTVGSKLHIVYKDEAEVLRYRTFDGASFSGSTVIDAHSDWAMQPAITEVDGSLFVFWNHQISTNHYELRLERLSSGSVSVLDSSSTWKGYLAAPAHLSGDASQVLCGFGNTVTVNDSGYVRVVRVSRTPTSSPPATGGSGSTGGTDAGTGSTGGSGGGSGTTGGTDAGSGSTGGTGSGSTGGTDAGSTTGTASADGTLLFSDDFARTDTTGVGANWTIQSGLWRTANFTQSDLDGEDLAHPKSVICADCRVQARAVGFGVPTTALYLRESTSGSDRYELALTGSGMLQLQRIRSGVATVLTQATSGAALNDWATLSLSASGSNPVVLRGYVNGALKLQFSDSATDRLTASGYAGLHTGRAGVAFDDFRIYALQSTSTSSPPPPTTTGALFSDDFTRTTMGTDWDVPLGAWLVRNNQVQSDRDSLNLALEKPVHCADCRVEARVIGFGVPDTTLVLRAGDSSPYDRYEVSLEGDGKLQIRRWRGNVMTVLGTAPSGLSDLTAPATISLAASGSTLTASVNGAARLSVTDSTLTTAGRAGMATGNAGVVFDQFRVTAK